MTEAVIKLALFGSPIGSSLSPRIHGLFARQCGLQIEFQRIETGADGFADALQAFHLAGGHGCNVTLPIKRDAWQLAVESSPAVGLAQAANTLLRQPTGWSADNTDGAGLVADLTANHGLQLAGKQILIFGAGGATAGILSALLACNPTEITLVNRTSQRALDLAEQFSGLGHLSVNSLQQLGRFDLIINATSLGHQGQHPPLTRDLFAADAVCYDLNYFKAAEPLRNYCRELRKPYIDGLGMLVEQAAKSFCFWTGKRPDSKAVIETCRSELEV